MICPLSLAKYTSSVATDFSFTNTSYAIFLLTEPLELVRLRLQHFFLLKVVWYLNLVNHYSVIVNFSEAVRLLQVGPADLVV